MIYKQLNHWVFFSPDKKSKNLIQNIFALEHKHLFFYSFSEFLACLKKL